MARWKDPEERHSDAMVEAIHNAARQISHSITEGFKLMADTEAAALADLTSAISSLGDAIAGEIGALQTAVTAATNANPPLQPDHAADIQAAVTRLNDFTAALKASVAPAAPADVGKPAAPTS